LESSIHEEVEDLIAFFKTQVGKPISLKHTFEIAVINTLWNIVASKKYKLDDPEAIYMHKICYEGFIEPEVAGAVYFIPWVAKLFPEWTGYNALKLAVKKMLKIFQDMVDERQKTYNPDQLNDFVDFYLKEIASTKDPKSSFYKEEGIKNLIHVLLDLFTAGSDTTSSTLCWTFLYLLTYPEVMGKVQQEVDTVVGRMELPTLADRIKMPYTDATMCEIFRMSSIVCGALLHSTLIDTSFEGFFLPKGTIVMGNLYHVHHDPGYWGDPENFRPERFLTPEGILRKDDALMPFSTGKRICPAESLASTNFFLFFTSLIQKFEFHVDPNHPLPSLDAKAGLVLATQPYKVVLRNRI
jgi:cytochrome P450